MSPRVRGSRAVATPAAPSEAHEAAVGVARTLDRELAWYFSYAETAHRLGHVALLPSHEATRLASDSDDAVLLRARQLATTVQATLHALPAHHAGVLRAVYTPRRWPVAVTREFEDLSAIVVRLACADDPWPARTSHEGLEQAAALHLARLLAIDATRPAELRKKARRLMGGAITAYMRARAATRSTSA